MFHWSRGLSVISLVGISWLVGLTEIPALAAPCAPPTLEAPCAYVAYASGGFVAVINTTTKAVITRVIIGGRPIGVAIDPDGSFVYVADNANNSIFVIDTSTNALIGSSILVGDSPEYIEINPAGSRLYVTNAANRTGVYSISVIDIPSNMVIATIPLSAAPHGIAVDPDGTKVYVATDLGLAIINSATNSVIGSPISVGAPAYGVAVHPTTTCVYVTSQSNSALSVIDATAETVVGSPITLGVHPRGVAVHPSGSHVYVANGDDNTVSVVDTATNTESERVSMPGPNMTRGVAVHPTGTDVYVILESDVVSVLDTATNHVIGNPILAGPGSSNTIGRFIGPEEDQPAARTQCHVIIVNIDIKPGSDLNCFNKNSSGVIPVAILGSAEFHATEIDPGTVTLAGLAVKVVGKSNKFLAHIEDVNHDGFDDLVVQIEDTDGRFTAGTTTATLTGKLYATFGSTPIEGTDSICIVP
jgi:YVTN family beta-propeller protein